MYKAIVEALTEKPMTFEELALVIPPYGNLTQELRDLVVTDVVAHTKGGKYQLVLNLYYAYQETGEWAEYTHFIVAALTQCAAKEAILTEIGANLLWSGATPTYTIIGTTILYTQPTVIAEGYLHG